MLVGGLWAWISCAPKIERVILYNTEAGPAPKVTPVAKIGPS